MYETQEPLQESLSFVELILPSEVGGDDVDGPPIPLQYCKRGDCIAASFFVEDLCKLVREALVGLERSEHRVGWNPERLSRSVMVSPHYSIHCIFENKRLVE